MLGMEMMLSNLVGMKPDEMKAAVAQVIAAIDNASKMLTQINTRLAATELRIEQIAKHLELDGEETNGRERKQLSAPSGSEYIQL